MLLQVEIDGKLMPKPRGKVGAKGNIYHRDKRYLDYKKSIEKQVIKSLVKGYQWDYPLSIALVHEYTLGRGAEPDLVDNQLGSFLDCLTQGQYIRDDSRRFIRSSFVWGIESDRDYSTFWLFDGRDLDAGLDLFWGCRYTTNQRLLAQGFKSRYKPL